MYAGTKSTQVKRLTVAYGLPYENATILSIEDERTLGVPNWFEEEQISFTTSKDGLITIPERNLIVVHLNGRTTAPTGSVNALRITLEYELVYPNIYIIDPAHYEKLGIPMIYHQPKQFVFVCSEGTFVTHDYNVVQLHLGMTKKIKRK